MTTTSYRTAYTRQIALWVLRALSGCHTHPQFPQNLKHADSDLTAFLDLHVKVRESTLPVILQQFESQLAALETTSKPVGLSSHALRNFSRFAGIFHLNPTEVGIMQFLACTQIDPILAALQLMIDDIISSNPGRYYSTVLGLPRLSIAKALEPNARLIQSGLLKSCCRSSKDFEFFSKHAAQQLFRKVFDPNEVIKKFGVSPPPPVLNLADYPHLQPTLDLLVPYLKKSISRRKSGVNILFHGPPGTGKTQLARVVGQSIDVPVFEFATEDEDGDVIRATTRLNAMRVSLSLFGNTSTLFVFDEAEDVIAPTSFMEKSAAQTHKGWFNRLLEENKSPIVWISNSIESLDPACARRFDFIVEVPIPPRKQRRKMLNDRVGKILTPVLIEQLAESEHLSPAVVARTHDIIRSIGKDLHASERDAAFCRLIANTLKAQGHPDPTKSTIQVIQPGLYDIDHLNTPADLPQIAAQLKQNPSARLCLYGPPGTGKTAFGHWLAGELSQPLQITKASDLLSAYVGMTEQKIARAFESAVKDGAILLIDEVDSFLQDRTRAKHSWEVTQINEMLTQIESFPGILIASSNLIDQFDPASLRRFDIKIPFGYLLPAQASRLLISHCQKLGLPHPFPEDLALTAAMETATPGDFAAVARQHRFQPFRDAGGFLQAVIRELEHKSVHLRRIGFQ